MNIAMLTPSEITSLESLLDRARRAEATDRSQALDALAPGDVVQLRPGIDKAWDASLILVKKANAYDIRGEILRPHRGGCPEAWYKFAPGEVVRLGRAQFPDPPADIKSWPYCPPCPKEKPAVEIRIATAAYREARQQTAAELSAEQLRAYQIDAERKTAQRAKTATRNAIAKTLRRKTP